MRAHVAASPLMAWWSLSRASRHDQAILEPENTDEMTEIDVRRLPTEAAVVVLTPYSLPVTGVEPHSLPFLATESEESGYRCKRSFIVTYSDGRRELSPDAASDTRSCVSGIRRRSLHLFPRQMAVVFSRHTMPSDSHHPRRRVVWQGRCNVNSKCASCCCFTCMTHQTAEVSLPPTSKRACLLTPFPPSLSFRFLLLLPICSVSHTPCI